MSTVPVVCPLEQGDKQSKLGAMHSRRRTGTFFAQNDGLKYACELLRARLIVPMVNIGMKKARRPAKLGVQCGRS